MSLSTWPRGGLCGLVFSLLGFMGIEDVALGGPENSNRLKVPEQLRWRPPALSLQEKSFFNESYEWLSKIFNHSAISEGLKGSYTDNRGMYWLKMASMQNAVGGNNAQDSVRSIFGEKSMVAFSDELKRRSEFIRNLKDGLKFNLDFSGSAVSSISSGRKVRYGLVLKDIKVRKSNQSGSVARYETKPVWTIGPVAEEEALIYRSAPAISEEESPFRIPSPKFSVQLKPQMETMSAATGGIPGFDLDLAQDEGFYSIRMPVMPDVRLDEAVHHFTFFLPQNRAIERSMNHSRVLKTGAKNILGDGRPTVNVNYDHTEDMFASEWHISRDQQNIKVSSRVPADWDPAGGVGGGVVEWRLEYEKGF